MSLRAGVLRSGPCGARAHTHHLMSESGASSGTADSLRAQLWQVLRCLLVEMTFVHLYIISIHALCV